MIQRSCACGAMVKIADLDNRTIDAVLLVWDELHAPSWTCDPVMPHIASTIRSKHRRINAKDTSTDFVLRPADGMSARSTTGAHTS